MRPREDFIVESDDGERFFGNGPCRLLRAVSVYGSLHAAASSMKMAYTKATRLVREAEKALGFNLTHRTIGGEGGGGSELTPEARDFLGRYEAWQRLSEKSSVEIFNACFSGMEGLKKCGCVIMAAGQSRRFGSNKLLAKIAGRRVIDWTLDGMPTDCVDVLVVTRPGEVEDAARDRGFDVLVGDYPEQSDSLHAAVEAMEDYPACMFLAGDQPFVHPDSIRELVGAMQYNPSRIWRLGQNNTGSGPILFPQSTFEQLMYVTGDKGGNGVFAIRPELTNRVRIVEAKDPLELMDVDTPEKLSEVEGMFLKNPYAVGREVSLG